MRDRQERALDVLTKWAQEVTIGMTREEAALFFDRLADWAYAQNETCLTDPETEILDYEEDGI